MLLLNYCGLVNWAGDSFFTCGGGGCWFTGLASLSFNFGWCWCNGAGFFFFLVFSALFSSFLIGSLCNLLNYFVMSRVSEPKSAYRNKSVFTPPCFSRKKCKSLCKEYNFSLKYSNKYGIRFSHIFKIPIILNEKPSISIEIPSISIKNLESRSKY